MRHRFFFHPILITALCALFLYALISFGVYTDRVRTMDFSLTVKLQDHFPKRFDDNVASIVDLAGMEIQAAFFFVLVLLLPLQKKQKLSLFIFYAMGLLATLLVKSVLDHPAPPYMFQRLSSGLPFPKLHVQVDGSYPSGHTYRSVFAAATVFFCALVSAKRKVLLSGVTVLLSIETFLVMVGLIILGKHWSSDVAGGMMLAIGLSAVAISLPMYRQRL